MLYRDIDKCPYSDSFWISKVMRSRKEEEMKKHFKFHLICNLRSKESSLVPKLSGRTNNNFWKCIVRLQKVNFQPKHDENIRLINEWGKNMAYFIDKLVLEGKYYTPYRFASNLTPEEEQPLSYYITIEEIFKVLKIRYPYYTNETVLKMLEKENLVSNYFDSTSFEEAIEYVKNRVNQTTDSNLSSISNNDRYNVSTHTRLFMENLKKN